MRSLYTVVAILALLGASYAVGYHRAKSDDDAHATAAQQAQAVKDADKARELLASEQQRRILAQSLEDQANVDPVVYSDCLSSGRVRRINSR